MLSKVPMVSLIQRFNCLHNEILPVVQNNSPKFRTVAGYEKQLRNCQLYNENKNNPKDDHTIYYIYIWQSAKINVYVS